MATPNHVQQELSTLSEKQKAKFYQLLAWSGNSGFPGSQVDLLCYERILDMVKRMGSEAEEAVASNGMPNYSMEFHEHIGKWFLTKK